jgi:hypothetical protein
MSAIPNQETDEQIRQRNTRSTVKVQVFEHRAPKIDDERYLVDIPPIHKKTPDIAKGNRMNTYLLEHVIYTKFVEIQWFKGPHLVHSPGDAYDCAAGLIISY